MNQLVKLGALPRRGPLVNSRKWKNGLNSRRLIHDLFGIIDGIQIIGVR